MPANTSNVITGFGLNVSVVGVSGAFFGMPIEAMVLGAIGGAVALGLNKPADLSKAAITILTSIVLAGACSPLAVAYLVDKIHLGDPNDEIIMLKALVPTAIGAGWMWTLPRLAEYLSKNWHDLMGVVLRHLVEKHTNKDKDKEQ